MGPFWDQHVHSFLLEEELAAAFALCRQRGYDVMAHATNPDAVKAALTHWAPTPSNTGTSWTMSAFSYSWKAAPGTFRPWASPILRPRRPLPSAKSAGSSRRTWRRTWWRAPKPPLTHTETGSGRPFDSGVKMALGSDLYPLTDSALSGDGAVGQVWRDDVADAAGRHQERSGPVRQSGADLGTVEVGKIADLIVVGGNPLDDIENLSDLLLVLKEGRVVADYRV